MRVVIALGGNALLQRDERPDADVQRRHLDAAARDLAAVAAEHETIIVHGNGPQVGMLARESEADESLSRPYPLGDLVAESQGLIGSWIRQELLNEHFSSAVALVTHVVVDADDEAFGHPTKPIGAVYDDATAHRLASERGWDVREVETGWRRVVPSPRPLDIDAVVQHARQDCPSVEVDLRVVHGQPAMVLREESRSADLLVVGQSQSGLGPGHLGGTVRALLRESACPVEMLPVAAARTPGASRLALDPELVG